MQPVIQSLFFKALTCSLLESLWQTGFLWLMVFVVLRLIKLSAAQKFFIAISAQFSGCLWFIATFIKAYNSTVFLQTVQSKNLLSTFHISFIYWQPYISVAYLCVLLYKITELFFVYRHSRSLTKSGLQKMIAPQRIFLQQMAQLLSVHKKVTVFLSDKINCPLTIGFLKPVILVPVAAVNYLTTEQMEAVLLHELAHIKRADYLLFFFQCLIEKVFFFNIFFKMLGDILERERENACDDLVLQFRYNAIHYAEALLKLGRIKSLPVFALPATGKKESVLLMRVKRLLTNSAKPVSISVSLSSLFFGLITMLIAVVLLQPDRAETSAKKTVFADEIQKISRANKQQYQPKNDGVTKEKIKVQQTIKPALISKNQLKRKEYNVQFLPGNNIQEVATANGNQYKSNQNYFVNVQQRFDSLQYQLPEYKEAVNARLLLTNDVLQKAISYQNFKQIESMLTATGDSVNVIEDAASKNSYLKKVTIESFDKNGNKNIYKVIIQLYQ